MFVCRFELCAAAGVCDDGEFEGFSGGDGGGGVAARGVHVGEDGVSERRAGFVFTFGLHRDVLRWRPTGVAGVAEVPSVFPSYFK